MVKLNRTTEYGLIALRHMSRRRFVDPVEVTSAREIADRYGLPFEITAKTLQRLKDTGLIESAQGARGGYMLKRPLSEISLGEFLVLMEGQQSVVACAPLEASFESGCGCEYHDRCEIKGLLSNLNNRVQKFLGEITLAELAESPGERMQLPIFRAPQRGPKKKVLTGLEENQ